MIKVFKLGWIKKAAAVVILLVSTISCGHDTPKFNDPSDPFIVDKIEKYNETHSIYFSKHTYGNVDIAFVGKARVCLPTGKYNIGDTVKLFTAEDLWGDFLTERLSKNE